MDPTKDAQDQVQAFTLRAATGPWGDYGRILANGISMRRDKVSGRGQLQRTGPFVPTVTFPGLGFVVPEATRQELQKQEFSGIHFDPVELVHIVRVDWETWDRSASAPLYYPPGNEPEGYILQGTHDAQLAQRIGPMWECKVAAWGRAKSELISVARPRKSRIILTAEPTPMPDFFQPGGWGPVHVSRRARDWLERTAREWVSLEPVAFSPSTNGQGDS